MVEVIAECARACMVSTGLEEDAPRIPAVAAPGTVLCSRCAARLAWRLGDVADIAARARFALVPGQAAAGTRERIGGAPDVAVPFNVAAMVTCDRLVNLVGQWCIAWGAALRVQVPTLLRRAAAAGAVLDGVKAGTDADAVAVTLEEWVWWLRRQMPGILAHQAAARFHDEVVREVARAERRFPRGEERVVTQQRPRYCPVCELQQVRVTWSGLDPLVQCSACKWEFETEWGELLESIGIEHRGA